MLHLTYLHCPQVLFPRGFSASKNWLWNRGKKPLFPLTPDILLVANRES